MTTRRESIIEHLKSTPASIDSLTEYFEVQSGIIVSDLEHIFKSIKRTDFQLLIRPAECLNCHYSFSAKRKRLSDPKKCPNCHEQRIKPQLFKIDPK